jgi:hypothetical protein
MKKINIDNLDTVYSKTIGLLNEHKCSASDGMTLGATLLVQSLQRERKTENVAAFERDLQLLLIKHNCSIAKNKTELEKING